MTNEKRKELIQERDTLEHKNKNSKTPDPKDIRRIMAIRSLLLTDGETTELSFSIKSGTESKRVTSFTKERR